MATLSLRDIATPSDPLATAVPARPVLTQAMDALSGSPQKPPVRPRRRPWKRLVTGVILVVAGVAAVILTIQLKPAFAATFADNYLRPIIGNRATIALEDSMLSLTDDLKRMAYGTIAKPNAHIFTGVPTAAAPLPTPAAIPSQSSLKAAAAAALTAEQALDLAPLGYFQPNFAKLAGEGDWSLVALPQFHGQPLMARTFVRPDPARSYAIVALVQMNMHQLHLHAVAGTKYPGGVLGHPGPGIIPAADIQSNDLVAGFNGGFQYIDGHYGMVVGPETIVPLKAGLGTLTIYSDGTLTINRYDPAAPVTKPVDAIRQNGPLIVDNGQVTNDSISGGYGVWGRTTTNSIFTWRSGIGLTPNGNLIYAVGPSLSTATLAQALKAGGAAEAIQLDINAFWVRFVTFTPTTSGQYSYESLLTTLANGGYSYLHGYQKDFFYVTGAPLALSTSTPPTVPPKQ